MTTPAALLPELRYALDGVAQPDRRAAMIAYMRGQYDFLGVSAGDRKKASQPFIASGKNASEAELFAAADACWAQPEREFQNVAVDLLRRWVKQLDDLARVDHLIRTKSWWDTVDALAAHIVGPMVASDLRLVATMDDWIDDSDIWIVRTAILHQLTYKERTDSERLFGYVDKRCGDTEFFIRKACGWALRQYARVDPDAVRAYVASRGSQLSGLTRREALKHL